MKFGSYELDIVSDGRIWLDGGAMFGVVPKPLWSRIIEVDEMNRVPLDTSCLLVRGSGANVLIETGIGDHYTEKQHKIYKFDFSDRLLENLGKLNVKPEDIDQVIQTHLHFDHAGSLLERSKSGNYGLVFPNAEVVVQKGEWETAFNPDIRSKPSYFPPEFYQTLMKETKVRLVEGSTELMPGISLKQMGGHTLHHQGVEISQGDEKVVYVGDFIPMTRHINIAYSMGFDVEPIRTAEDKNSFLPQAAEGNWILVFVHDPDTPCARVRNDNGKWVTERVEF